MAYSNLMHVLDTLIPQPLDFDEARCKYRYGLAPEAIERLRAASYAARSVGESVAVIGRLIAYADMRELKDDWRKIAEMLITLGELAVFLDELQQVGEGLPVEASAEVAE